MSRLLRAAGAALCVGLGFVVSAHSQMTPVTATGLKIKGVAIPSGFVTMTLVNNLNQPVAFVTSDGTLNGPQGYMATITNGAISGFSVADMKLSSAVTSGTPLNYLVTVQQTTAPGSSYSFTIPASTPVVNGITAFALDHYAPAQTVALPASGLQFVSTVPSNCTVPSMFYTAAPAIYACVGGTPTILSGSGGSSLAMGTVTTLAPGAQATATITNGQLNLGIPAGAAGASGATGATGTSGISPTVSVLNTTTLTAGSSATVAVDSSSTPSNVKLNFGIPQGVAGAAGTATSLPSGATCGFNYAGATGTTVSSFIGSYTTTVGTGTLTGTGLYENGATHSTQQAGCMQGAATILINYTTDAASMAFKNNQYGFVLGNGQFNTVGWTVLPDMPGQAIAPNGTGVMTAWNRDIVTGTVSACLVMGNTGKVYLNGKAPISSLTSTGNGYTWTSTADNVIGQNAGFGFGWSGTVHSMVVWPSELTQAQCRQATEYMNTQLAPFGVTLAPEPNWNLPIIVVDGDSINVGLGANFTWNVGIPNQAVAYLGDTVNYQNVAISGQGIQTGTIFNTKVMPLLQKSTGARIVLENAATNEIASGSTAAASLTNITTYCTSVHSLNAKCVVSTIIPRVAFTAQMETYRLAYNSGLLPLVANGTIDALDDRANDPVVGNGSNMAVTTCSPDGVHPTALCAQRLVFAQALGIHRVMHPGTPFWLKVDVPFNAFTGSTATSYTQTLVQLMPNEKVCGLTARVKAAFVGSGVTAFTASVGDSTGTTTQYAPSLNLLASGTQDAGAITYISPSGAVQASFSETGGTNMAAFTAGDLQYNVCVVQQ